MRHRKACRFYGGERRPRRGRVRCVVRTEGNPEDAPDCGSSACGRRSGLR
jgi:hypothetical protein